MRTVPLQSPGYSVELEQSRLTQLLKKFPSGIWRLKLPVVYGRVFDQPPPPQMLLDLETWPHICQVRLHLCPHV